MNRAHASLLAIWFASFLLAPWKVEAQLAPIRPQVNEPVPDTGFVPREPFIDRNVTSVLERFSAWEKRMKKEHFTAYLIAYTCFWSTLFGSIYGILAFRFGDAMALYRRIRKNILLLSLAVGMGLGVLVAVSQIPPNSSGKVTLLLMVIAVATVVTSIATMAVFTIQRSLLVAKNKRAGLPVSGRLRSP